MELQSEKAGVQKKSGRMKYSCHYRDFRDEAVVDGVCMWVDDDGDCSLDCRPCDLREKKDGDK